MKIETFYDNHTATFTHIVIDEATKHCAIIDSVLDYDQFAGKSSTDSADRVIEYVKQNDLTCEWILETHVHADHITAATTSRKTWEAKSPWDLPSLKC